MKTINESVLKGITEYLEKVSEMVNNTLIAISKNLVIDSDPSKNSEGETMGKAIKPKPENDSEYYKGAPLPILNFINTKEGWGSSNRQNINNIIENEVEIRVRHQLAYANMYLNLHGGKVYHSWDERMEDYEHNKDLKSSTYGDEMSESEKNLEIFKSITALMAETYYNKNLDYGSSFDESLDENGLIASSVRIGDKYKRFKQLISNDSLIKDESIRDTLLDMANYCIMTVMWMDEDNKETITLFADGEPRVILKEDKING